MHKELGHYLAMRIRRSVGLALGIVVLMASSPASFADASPTPSPSPTTYQGAMELFHNQIDAREQRRKEINSSFMIAVTAANSAAKSAMRKAKTVEAKTTVLIQQKNAIALATTMRDAAIVAMGPLPVEPVEPVSPVSTFKQSEPTKSPKATEPTKSPKVSKSPKPTEPSEQSPIKKTKSD